MRYLLSARESVSFLAPMLVVIDRMPTKSMSINALFPLFCPLIAACTTAGNVSSKSGSCLPSQTLGALPVWTPTIATFIVPHTDLQATDGLQVCSGKANLP